MAPRIDQTIHSLTIRLNGSITPDLTIQYWGQPFSGDIKYSEYKIITDPKAEEYTDRFHTYTPSEISYANELGCDIVKIFPGGLVGGPAFAKSVMAPSPWLKLMPRLKEEGVCSEVEK